jgi:acetoacetyl-CoA synthetase
MAADYVTLLQQHQPEGPYALMGYSFGGLLAYDIAVRLRRAGKAVDFLGLIDTDVQGGALLGRERIQFEIETARHVLRRISALQMSGAAKRLWQKIMRKGQGAVELPSVLRRVREACETAFVNYDPPPYDGTVIFFRSPERRPFYCDPLSIWRRRAADLRVTDVLGGHISMMLEPDVASLAGKIDECIMIEAGVDGSDAVNYGMMEVVCSPALEDHRPSMPV